jgi:hypothetical protein
MRTQNEIQNDIRELRRQLDALNGKVTKKTAKHAESEFRTTRQREAILAKIKVYSSEYMASLAVNRY